jgi:alanyl-tRNA synthetase
MSTERLYYADPYLLSFAARVTGRRQIEGRPALTLDRTAFYPAAGGQPHDLGTLNGIPVVEVREEEGDVLHLLERDLPGEAVQGEVDGQRRFDHMQQHTGQHILSEAALQLLGAATVGFHLSADYSTVDLDRAPLSPADLERVEDQANEIVFQDRPVTARFVGPEELARLPLRKPPAVQENVRIVEVAGFDWSPCGGTHCTRTGQIGLIRIVRAERMGRDTRLTFLCGWRALRDARWRHAVLEEASAALTAGAPELPAAVARLQAAEQEARKELERARRQLLHYEAIELHAQGEPAGPARVVRAAFSGRTLDELKVLAREIAALPGGVALLGLRGDDARVCFARAEGLPHDMGALVREAVALLGGRGGGRPNEAQGGGPQVERLDEALELARARLQPQGGAQAASGGTA